MCHKISNKQKGVCVKHIAIVKNILLPFFLKKKVFQITHLLTVNNLGLNNLYAVSMMISSIIVKKYSTNFIPTRFPFETHIITILIYKMVL